LKGEMVNIYKKPQVLINYLKDTFWYEGYWVLDFFSSSSKNYDIIFMKLYFNLILFLICLFTVYKFIIYFVWWLGTPLTCCLQKGRNCITIESDPMQCNFIQQIINAIKALPEEMQEVGLKKWGFSGSRVAKMLKELEPH
jgi:hypothetical protein